MKNRIVKNKKIKLNKNNKNDYNKKIIKTRFNNKRLSKNVSSKDKQQRL